MKYDDIKNPNELLEYMNKNIVYGFVTKDGVKHFGQSSETNKVWYENGVVQDGLGILKTKCGTCWDQVELERKWFLENGYKIIHFLKRTRVYF